MASTTCLFPHLLFTMLQDCYCLTVGIVDEIIIDAPWSYDSCPNCTTTFDPSKGGSACRSCHTNVIDTVPRLAMIIFCTDYLFTRFAILANFPEISMDVKV